MAAIAKRKRDANDMPNPRAPPNMTDDFDHHQYMHADDGMGHHHGNMDFAAALNQHNTDPGDMPDLHHQHNPQGDLHQQGGPSASDTAAAAMAYHHTMTVPQSTEQAFMTQPTETPNDRPTSSSIDQGSGVPGRSNSFGDFDMGPNGGQANPNGATSPTAPGKGSNGPKPQVGTEEWHKLRRDNHKEVERRRRETINEGINELAKIVPGCEKNKGSILARAVQFITQLKENETQNIEKWTLEKLLTEQAIAELSSSCDKLKAECQRAWAECEQWKKAAQKNGITIDTGEKEADAEDA
ncbi:hypothetical protein AC578_8671 [Pseudocercospora eumusae]|uniref:BHLH domain-containing protein n=1 Tax=Pseudocercospora eumusae TaxID=321146 RepID=A0A139HQ54_9PEZI|nr:hypothetical protein AC578_8671 [Pseudocercospora eumusae]